VQGVLDVPRCCGVGFDSRLLGEIPNPVYFALSFVPSLIPRSWDIFVLIKEGYL